MNDSSFTGTLNGKKLLFRSFDETGEIQVTDVSKEISLIIKYSEIKWINNPVSPIIKCTNDTGEHFRHISGTDVFLRLSLCFPGDVVQIIRKVLFTGAGMHREVHVMRIE